MHQRDDPDHGKIFHLQRIPFCVKQNRLICLVWDFVGLVVSNHIAESSRKNLYSFYGNAALFVDQVLEFSLFNRNKNPLQSFVKIRG